MYITCAKKNKTKLIYKRKVIYITSPIQSYVSVVLTLWKKEKERKKKHSHLHKLARLLPFHLVRHSAEIVRAKLRAALHRPPWAAGRAAGLCTPAVAL